MLNDGHDVGLAYIIPSEIQQKTMPVLTPHAFKTRYQENDKTYLQNLHIFSHTLAKKNVLSSYYENEIRTERQ